MDVERARGARNLPEAEKRGEASPGAVTIVFLIALPLLLVFFLFGDRAASIAADSPVVQLVKGRGSSNASSPNPTKTHDRLLGGLLSPEFNDETCRSRYRASQHWKSSPFPVSPYLVQKLREYEANHKKCGPQTVRYREAVEQLKSGHNAEHAECKYVVWFPLHGLGNRMLSIVSTFLYALLTNRVLLVHESQEMEGLFCEPFPGSSWLLPPDFPYQEGFWGGAPESYAHMLENNVIQYDNANASALPAYVYFHLENIGLKLENRSFCEEDHRLLNKFNWMVLKSDSYFAVALFLMPMHQDELEQLFPVKQSVFQHLGRYIFHPTNQVWGIIQRYYDGYLAHAEERVGIQIRIFPQLPVPSEIMYEQILRCSREENLLPPVSSGVSEYSPLNATKVKAVLVVSLKPEYYAKLQGMYYANATVTGDIVTVYQPSHDRDQHTEAQTHNQKALAEMYLLSYCDKILITGGSTFGYVAHSLAGSKPWMLHSLDWGKMRADVACVRSDSVEPCLHSPPNLDCQSGKDLDPVAHVPFVRHCEDVDAGLKLSD